MGKKVDKMMGFAVFGFIASTTMLIGGVISLFFPFPELIQWWRGKRSKKHRSDATAQNSETNIKEN